MDLGCLQGPRYPLEGCVGKGREHDHMDVGGRTNQDEYRTYSGENVGNIFSRQSRGAEAYPPLVGMY